MTTAERAARLAAAQRAWEALRAGTGDLKTWLAAHDAARGRWTPTTDTKETN